MFPGKYVCKECGHDLFRSQNKYKHHTPWPAFSNTIHTDSVSKKEERKGALKVQITIQILLFSLFYVVTNKWCVLRPKIRYVCLFKV